MQTFILSSRRLSHLLLFTSLNFTLSPQGESLSGDYRRGVPPVPIPNTAVKPSAANGSRTLGPARVGHCQIMARFFERRAGPLFCPCNSLADLAARLVIHFRPARHDPQPLR